jgi:hypothetical protein
MSLRIGVISTMLPELKASVVTKTPAELETRLSISITSIVSERRVNHEELGNFPRRDGSNVPIVGAPGCARSPKVHGFDVVPHRLPAGLPPSRRDVPCVGVGGFMNDIDSRYQGASQ